MYISQIMNIDLAFKVAIHQYAVDWNKKDFCLSDLKHTSFTSCEGHLHSSVVQH